MNFVEIHEKISYTLHNGGGELEFPREDFTQVCRILGNLTYFDFNLSNISVSGDGDTVFLKIEMRE